MATAHWVIHVIGVVIVFVTFEFIIYAVDVVTFDVMIYAVNVIIVTFD